MNEKTELREDVWKQLVDYIESEDLFFPVKIRQRISAEVYDIFDSFIDLMLRRKMLLEFRKKSVYNRIAHWLLKFKMRKKVNKTELVEIYVKGPNWEIDKARTFSDLLGDEKPIVEEVIH